MPVKEPIFKILARAGHSTAKQKTVYALSAQRKGPGKCNAGVIPPRHKGMLAKV